MSERRQSILRRDLNDLVRDEAGHLSPSKIGTLVGQWLSVKLILEHGSEIIANWDSLTVLFTILIAPELLKKLMNMKYGGGTNGSSTVTTTDKTVVTKSKEVT